MARDGGVLVVGAGFAGLEAALALHALTEGRARVRVLTPSSLFSYVPASVTEPFSDAPWGEVPLGFLAHRGGFTLVKGTVGRVEPDDHAVHTLDGRELAYDALIVAVGARRREWLPGASVTFRGPGDVRAYRDLVGRLVRAAEDKRAPRLVIVVPSGPTWSLPAYELALLTAGRLRAVWSDHGAEVVIVTAEERPLALFGRDAADEMEAQLAEAGVAVLPGRAVRGWVDGVLLLTDGADLEADEVVAMPTITGPSVPGLPSTPLGFIPVDRHGWVADVVDVLAAGDATDFPVKQGGVACQMADTAAATVAMLLGEPVDPIPFAPVLRGQVWSPEGSCFVRTELGEESGVVSRADPLWWPPGKVAGRWLAPALAGVLDEQELRDVRPPG